MFRFLLLVLMSLLATDAAAQGAIPILSAVQGQAGETEYSVTLQLLGLMTVLTLLPSILLMMTSFTRIIIVLSLLKQDQHLKAKTLETAAAKIGAQLSALYGINSPDFFEKSLFSTFVSTLRAQSVISTDLSASPDLHRVESVIAETIDANVRYNIRHAVNGFHTAHEAAG